MFYNNSTAYLICRGTSERFVNCIDIGVQNLRLHYANAEVVAKRSNDKTLIVVGTVVDSTDPDIGPREIAADLVESDDINELIHRSRCLAGRYVILYINDYGLYVLPDAVASIPVTFSYQERICIASNPKFIAEIENWTESAVSKQIKSRAAQTHPLPYDLTMYDQIKKVPPNHYFDYRTARAVRFYPSEEEKLLSLKEAVEKSNRLLKNVVIAYYRRYRLSLPLTSGMDSRTILALCRDFMDEIPTYTFLHDYFSEETADIVLPRKMAARFGFKHFTLPHTEIPNEVLKKGKEELGSNINISELQNVWTYLNSELKGLTRLDGNVSPLAKSSFGRNLPECFATPSYLVTKTHNFSKENKQEVIRWFRQVKPSAYNSGISPYDLFFWEHRVGNWTANSYMTSDLLVDSRNIFNSRAIIETWLRVPRKLRVNGLIHKGIIKLNWPEVLEFPFNPDQKYALFYKNSLLYYFAVWGKYKLEGLKYI